MKVLMSVSNPFTNAPRVHSEAISLIQAGYEVTIIACDWQQQNPGEWQEADEKLLGEWMTTAEGKKRRVLIVSFYFPPANTIAAVRIGKFTKYLP